MRDNAVMMQNSAIADVIRDASCEISYLEGMTVTSMIWMAGVKLVTINKSMNRFAYVNSFAIFKSAEPSLSYRFVQLSR